MIPDYDHLLPVDPQEAIEETEEPWQKILEGSGYEEKRIELGDIKSYVQLRWPLLTQYEGRQLFDFFVVVKKYKTFRWKNPRNSKIYTVRFNEDLNRITDPSKVYSIDPVRLKIIGISGLAVSIYDAYDKETIIVSSTVVRFTQSKIAQCKIAFCTLDPNGGAIRFWMDGSTPTSTEGHYISPGQNIMITGNSNVSNFKAIRASTLDGRLQVSYHK